MFDKVAIFVGVFTSDVEFAWSGYSSSSGTNWNWKLDWSLLVFEFENVRLDIGIVTVITHVCARFF